VRRVSRASSRARSRERERGGGGGGGGARGFLDGVHRVSTTKRRRRRRGVEEVDGFAHGVHAGLAVASRGDDRSERAERVAKVAKMGRLRVVRRRRRGDAIGADEDAVIASVRG